MRGKYFWFWHSTLSLFQELVGPEFFNTYLPRISVWVAVRIENPCVAKMNLAFEIMSLLSIKTFRLTANVVSTTFSCIMTSLSAFSYKTIDSKSYQTQNYNRLEMTTDSKLQTTQNYSRLEITIDLKLQPTQNDSRLKIVTDSKLHPNQNYNWLKITADSKLQ